MEDSPDRNRVRLDSVNRISDRLLQGWTLLSDGCPDCGVPLLRKAPAPEMWCVNCEASYLNGQRIAQDYSTAADGATGGGGSTQPASPVAHHFSDDSTHSNGSSDAGGDADLDPTADPRLGPYARRSPAPAPTPASRAAMLDCGNASRSSIAAHPAANRPAEGAEASARVTPALASPPLAAGLSLEPAAASAGAQPQHRPVNGLAAGEAMHDSDVEDSMQQSHGMNGGLSHGGGRAFAGPNSAEAAQRRAESDRISAALGQKMLQGWALLDAYCPVCNTPLVRARDGRHFCVGCDMDVVRNGGQTPAGPSSAAGAAAAASPAQQANGGSPAAASAAGATAAPSDAEHAAARLRMYEAAGGQRSRTHDTGGGPGTLPHENPESPGHFLPPASAVAVAVYGAAPQGGQPAAPLPAGCSPDVPHSSPASHTVQAAAAPQRHPPPPWLPTPQQHPQQQWWFPTSHQLQQQPQRQGARQGSPKRGSDARSPPCSSPASGDRRKRERTGSPADLATNYGLQPVAAVPGARDQAGSASAGVGTADTTPHSAAAAQPMWLESPDAGRLGATPAPEFAPLPSPGGPEAPSAAAVIAAARNTLLTKMHQTERQLAAMSGDDVEALSRLTVLLGQQADALTALRRSI